MKKKAAALGIALTVCVAGVLSACGGVGKTDDMFPYDVAVQQGYTESEGKWLSDMTPEPTLYRRMWQEAVEDGSFTGTYFEFLQALELGDDSFYLQRALLSSVSIVAQASKNYASAGSGVILSVDETTGDMDILTNYHVVYYSAAKTICGTIEVCLYGGELASGSLKATYAGGSPSEDIALLHVDGDDVVTTDSGSHTNAEVIAKANPMAAVIGDSDSVLAGDRVYAIGNPEAWGLSVVQGVVSVDAEYVTMDAIVGTGQISMLELRTDATVNHGNSGGGLFNTAGELVGIINARSEADGVEGVGYAIPVDHAVAVAENIRSNGGELRLARLGITIETAESHSAYDPTSGRTFISEKISVVSVSEKSAAIAGGMDVGDTIISMTLNGKTVAVTRRFKISNLLLEIRKGDTLTLVVTRNNKEMTLTIPFDSDSYFEIGK